MGFSQHTHDTYDARGSGANYVSTPFFKLALDEKSGSPETAYTDPVTRQTFNGNFETVWFLNTFVDSPLVRYHYKSATQEKLLCAETFNQSCAICDQVSNAWDLIKDLPEAERKGKLPVSFSNAELMTLVYVPRRGMQHHIHRGKTKTKKVLPIYWLRVGDSKSIERMKEANIQQPLHTTPYHLFSPLRVKGEKTEYYLQPAQYNPNNMGIYVQHPLLSAPYMPDPTNPAIKNWDRQYLDTLELLSIVGYGRGTDQYNRPLDYGGYLDKALNLNKWCCENWPQPAVEVELPNQIGMVAGTPNANYQF